MSIIDDEKYMKIALELAKKGVGKVNPNPLVGAVIVKAGRIIGEGYHEYYGQAHAERNAVKNAREDVEGSTIYVTLEPCSHYGKTPPCVDLLIEKKFKRVVIGMLDPNPLVCGKSIEKLKKNNIETAVGIKEKECREMNEVFLKYITSNIPFVILKCGTSLDGKIATVSGESKWITNDKAREDGRKLRNKLSSIMVGVNTIIADNPKLTSRIAGGRDPFRIIVDSNLRTPLDSNVIQNDDNKTIIACTKNADKNKKKKLIHAGVKVIEVEEENNRVNLKKLLIELGKEKIDSILIEGGGTLNFSALEEKIVDKVRFYIAPKIIGGERSRGSISGNGFKTLKDAVKLKDIVVEQIDDNFMIEGYVDK